MRTLRADTLLALVIGSSEREWKEEEFGGIVARTIVNVLSNQIKEYNAVFCVGSTHYPRQFTKLALESEYAVGHICPKYALQYLDFEMFKQAIDRTYEKVERVFADKKLKSLDRKRIEEYANRCGLQTARL